MPETKQTELKIGITGKQNILPKEVSFVYNSIKEKIEEILKNNGTKTFVGYSSLAKGADTIFAEVVTKEFKQQLKIILPFKIEDYRLNFTNSNDLVTFDNWVKRYPDLVIVDKNEALDDQKKDNAYEETGKFLVDNCKEIIIVWDKLKPAGQGGTAEVLGLIACKRPIREIDIIYIKPIDTNGFHAEIARQTKDVDKEAKRLKRNYNFTWKTSVFLGWTAAVCFAINAGFEIREYYRLDNIMTLAECLLIFAMVVIISISKVRRYHLRFIMQRIKAEKLRLIEIFYNANLKIDIQELVSNNDDELSYLIQLTNNEIEKSKYVPKHYSFYCVKNLIEEQERYHRLFLKRKELKRVHFYEKLKKVIIAVFVVHISLSFFSLLMNWFFTSPLFTYSHDLSVFVSIFLSACFAGIETILFFREWEILRKNSERMQSYFKEEIKQLEENYTGIRPDELLKRVSAKMLTDNENWDSIFRGKPEEVKLF